MNKMLIHNKNYEEIPPTHFNKYNLISLHNTPSNNAFNHWYASSGFNFQPIYFTFYKYSTVQKYLKQCEIL